MNNNSLGDLRHDIGKGSNDNVNERSQELTVFVQDMLDKMVCKHLFCCHCVSQLDDDDHVSSQKFFLPLFSSHMLQTLIDSNFPYLANKI